MGVNGVKAAKGSATGDEEKKGATLQNCKMKLMCKDKSRGENDTKAAREI